MAARWTQYAAFLAITLALARPLAGLALALAGRLAAQGRREASRGTLPTDTPGFGAMVAVTAVMVGGLCYLPALLLGPILAHLSR